MLGFLISEGTGLSLGVQVFIQDVWVYYEMFGFFQGVEVFSGCTGVT